MVQEKPPTSPVAKGAPQAKRDRPVYQGSTLLGKACLLSGKIIGEFVDMAELLCDNTKAKRRRTKEGGSSAVTGQSSQNRWKISDILSWI